MDLKLFELNSLLNGLQQVSKQTQFIECCTYSNTILYVGTNDGYILRYSINETKFSNRKISYDSTLIDYKALGQKKPVQKIIVNWDIKKILVLIDNCLVVLNIYDLEHLNEANIKLKNVTNFNVTKFYKQIKDFRLFLCLKNHTIQIYSLGNDEKFILNKEISLNEPSLVIEGNKTYLVIASEIRYLLININSMTIQELFLFDNLSFPPSIILFSEDEFVVNSPNATGLIINPSKTKKTTIKWSDGCLQFQLINPYALCLSQDSIKIFSIYSSKLFQQIKTPNSRNLKIEYFQNDNFIILSSPNQIFSINLASEEYQLEQFIAFKCIDEALLLFEHIYSKLPLNQLNEKVKEFKKTVAFIEFFENSNFEKAKELFIGSNVDFKELAYYIPNLMLNESKRVLHFDTKKNIFSKLHENDSKIIVAKTILIDLMLEQTKLKDDIYFDVLFKLLAENRPKVLYKRDFLLEFPPHIATQHLSLLKDLKRHHLIALIYFTVNKKEEAMDIWKQLVNGSLHDEYFPGLDFVIDTLSKIEDAKIIWKYAYWALDLNEEKAISIFINRPNDELSNELLRSDYIINNLNSYKLALMTYLEYVITTKQSQKESHHTTLVSSYIDMIKNQNINSEELRKKLQNILQTSSMYRIPFVMDKFKDSEDIFQKEMAIIYSKTAEHDKALKILILKLKDIDAATEYCLINSKDSNKLRKELFQKLFCIFMESYSSDDRSLIKKTSELLNTNIYFYDTKIIDMIPKNWSINLINRYLENMIVKSKNNRTNLMVKKTLYNNLNNSLRINLNKLQEEKIQIDDRSKCSICNQILNTVSMFIREPNGNICHLNCAKRY